MNPYSIPVVITAALILFIGGLVYKKSKSSRTNIIFAFLCFSLFFWLLSYTMMYNASDPRAALFWARVGFMGISFIPVFAYHFVCLLTGRYSPVLLICFYIFIPCSVLLGWMDLVYQGVDKYFWGYYPVAGKLYFIFLSFCAGLFSAGALKLYFASERSKKEGRVLVSQQYRYVFYAFLVATTGLIDYVIKYRLNIYPFGYLSTLGFISIIAYAIAKYRLMDITVAFTRAGIFITVYTLVLGLPVWVGFKTMGSGPWVLPVALMAFLATGGPFLYLWIQRRAEARILSDQRKYQETLRQASAGMSRIRDLKKLLNLIVSILTRVVRIEHAFIYLWNKESQSYCLSASRRMNIKDCIKNELTVGHPLVAYFKAIDLPLVREEVHQKAERDAEKLLRPIEDSLNELKAEIVFPIYIRTELSALVVLGKKVNRFGYSEDDLSVFSILANQASLAIENARSYEDMKKTQEQLFRADKMATIGTMADGLSHQINNRLHALGFIASDMLDTLKLRKLLFATPELKTVADEFEYSLSRMQENVHHGGEIVRGLMKYTRKGEEGFTACNIDDVLTTAYEMAQFKIRSAEFKIIKEYDPQAVPKVKGNFTQLQEVFFNLIDNAYDATVQRKTELKEEGYTGVIRVSTHEVEGVLEIIFSDNGIGVNPKDKDKLFTPFFTTKATSKKGTGLGLYVIRKIVEDNHGGKVEVRSVFGQGTEMVCWLSIYR